MRPPALAGVLLLVVSCGAVGCESAGSPTAPGSIAGAPGASALTTAAPDALAQCLGGTRTSACQTGHTMVETHALTAPSHLTASVSGGVVRIEWTAATGETVTGYFIEAGSAPGLSNLAAFATRSTATTFQTTGVPPGTYYLRVRASNSTGLGPPSNEVVLQVGATSTPCVPPGPPGGLAITGNAGGTVRFAWSAGTGAPTSYVIEAGSATGRSDIATRDLGSPTLSLTTSGLAAGTYYIRVRSKNACGTSEPSNEVVLTVNASACTGLPYSAFVMDQGTWVGDVPVGHHAGTRLVFTIRYAGIQASTFSGTSTYVASDGRTGLLAGGGIATPAFTPRLVFGFSPLAGPVNTITLFMGDAAECPGGRVSVLSGMAYPGYIGTLPCQPGEICDPNWGTHITGPGAPMTLTRR